MDEHPKCPECGETNHIHDTLAGGYCLMCCNKYADLRKQLAAMTAERDELKKKNFDNTSALLELCTDFEQACQIARRMSLEDLRPYVLEALKIARQNGLSAKIGAIKIRKAGE